MTSRSHRDLLLDAAIECLQERGYARTTARDLVAASGTNLASIGYHFGSKERLLDAALAEVFRRWLAAMSASATAAPPRTAERLEEWIEEVLSAVRANRPIVVAFFEALAQAERSDELRLELAAAYDELRAGGARLVATLLGEAAEDIDLELAASLAMAALDGLLVQWLLDPGRLPSASELVAHGRSVAELARRTMRP